jgi:hypothetical protein
MVSLPEIDPASSMIVVETIVLMPLALSPVSVIQSGRAGRRVDFDLAAWPTAVRSVGAARDRPITLDSNHLIGDARTGPVVPKYSVFARFPGRKPSQGVGEHTPSPSAIRADKDARLVEHANDARASRSGRRSVLRRIPSEGKPCRRESRAARHGCISATSGRYQVICATRLARGKVFPCPPRCRNAHFSCRPGPGPSRRSARRASFCAAPLTPSRARSRRSRRRLPFPRTPSDRSIPSSTHSTRTSTSRACAAKGRGR